MQRRRFLMNIGEYVKQYRKEHGLSMQAFGVQCGLSRAYIHMLEKGINPTTGKPVAPTIETLNKIAEITGTTIDALISLLDDSQSIIVESKPIQLELSAEEIQLIKKYRQLDEGGKDRIHKILDFEIYQMINSAQKRRAEFRIIKKE